MRLLDIAAVAHPAGNRIDLSWRLPPDPPFTRVRVVRRVGTHPLTPNPASAAEGIVVPELAGRDRAVDGGLDGETVYYYGLFPYENTGAGSTVVVSDPDEQIDRRNRASALATSPLGLAEQMYGLLPLIYHRYDTAAPHDPPAGLAPEDLTRGALRRFLDLPGGQLDQLHSLARAALDFADPDRVDGTLLPLLAQWIGWQTDYGLELGAQRNELRNAPRIYRSIGLIPVVEATVKRISGRESRTKEFVHNVATTNRPERLNLWQRVRQGGTWGAAGALSLDSAYDDRPRAVRDGTGALRLFYHTEDDGHRSIWWKTFGDATGWSPSEPVVRGALDYKHPSAAVQGSRLRLFWSAYDRARNAWSIQSRSLDGGAWSAVETFVPPEGGPAVQRRSPVAVADNGGGVWLFWLELAANRWSLRYNRHNGTAWQVNPSPTFPADAGQSPRVLDDAFAVFHPGDAGQRLWLFWARQDTSGPDQTRWTVAYRVKAGLDPTAADWSQIRTLPKPAGGTEHDREPSVLLPPGGDPEVFWSSHRGGRWSVWRSVLNRATHAWGTPEELGAAPYSSRAPVAFANGADTVLAYRRAEPLRYASAVYSATETVDFRYCGSTTVDTRNAARLGLRGTFDDCGTYVYDAGSDGVRTNDDWYARDTVGVFLDETDPDEVSRLGQVLHEFLPATDRAVFLEDV